LQTSVALCMNMLIKVELRNAIKVVLYEKSYNMTHSEGTSLYFCTNNRTTLPVQRARVFILYDISYKLYVL
jgi:hypothetical protein